MFGLPTWAINAIGAVIIAAVIAGCGAHLAQLWYEPQVTALKATAHAQAARAHEVKTVQATLTKTSAAAETKAQAAIVRQARVIIKKVPVYVSIAPSPPVGCITNGMLRLHDAAVLGIDPASLPPPAGQPDGACSAISPSDFMATVAGNYAIARENAEQLDALEADLKARIEAVAPSPNGG